MRSMLPCRVGSWAYVGWGGIDERSKDLTGLVEHSE